MYEERLKMYVECTSAYSYMRQSFPIFDFATSPFQMSQRYYLERKH